MSDDEKVLYSQRGIYKEGAGYDRNVWKYDPVTLATTAINPYSPYLTYLFSEIKRGADGKYYIPNMGDPADRIHSYTGAAWNGSVNVTLATYELASSLPTQVYKIFPDPAQQIKECPRTIGEKEYELKDHLANVRVVISDEKFISDVNTNNVIDNGDSFDPKVLNYNDPYPFGQNKPSLKYAFSGNYRYGLVNGQEKDYEIDPNGNITSAENWEYDSRIARRWNLDPISQANLSDYACFANNPIMLSDPSGDTPGAGDPPDKKGTKEGETAQTTYFPSCKECTEYRTEDWIWHKGGVNGSKEGWMSPADYQEEVLKPVTQDYDKWVESNYNTAYHTDAMSKYVENLKESGLNWVGVLNGFSKYNKENPTVDGWQKYIPIWGSAKQAYLDFSVGKWGWGSLNSVLAVSDVFLVKSVVWNGGKFLIGSMGKSYLGSWGAYRALYGELGMAGFGEHMHHIILQRNGATTGSGFYWHLMNAPWNLKTMTNSSFLGLRGTQIHTLVHGNTVRALGLNWSNSILGNGLRLHYATNTFMKTTINFGIGKTVNSGR